MIWEIPNDQKKIFLTFDDGPMPEVTSKVINILNEFQVKATFFCVGKNIGENPDIYKMLLNNGHHTANHSFGHLNGWKIKNNDYFEDIEKCNKLVDSMLFRPPYGKIKRSQIKILKDNYKIIMWSILAGDFDRKFSKEDCVRNVIDNIRPGSIIVFHDSIKAKEKLLYALPRTLDYLLNNKFVFGLLNNNLNYER